MGKRILGIIKSRIEHLFFGLDPIVITPLTVKAVLIACLADTSELLHRKKQTMSTAEFFLYVPAILLLSERIVLIVARALG